MAISADVIKMGDAEESPMPMSIPPVDDGIALEVVLVMVMVMVMSIPDIAVDVAIVMSLWSMSRPTRETVN